MLDSGTMKKAGSFIILMLLFIIISAGCRSQAPQTQEATQPAQEAAQTIVPIEDVNAVISANNQFACEFYAKYKSQYGNIFFSPYSISTALAMTYEGARGQTSDQIRSVFHFPADDAMRRGSFVQIYNEINKKDKSYQLNTANALWAQKDYQFLNEYFNIVDKYYSGKVTNLDFVGDPEGSRATINSWVEEKTNNKIKDLIPPGAIDYLTRLIITNAIYFKGDWLKQFDKDDTKQEDFKASPDETVKAQMMRMTGEEAKFNYAEDGQLQILELPYSGKDLSMLVILPEEGVLDDAQDLLSADKIAKWGDSLIEQRVDVFIPKFKFETKYFIGQTLADMGMPIAFSGDADFSGMTGKRDLLISAVIHQAFVEVNEEGTEAAAATAVVMRMTSVMVPPKIKVFKADHPFIFIIQDKKTGDILFMGRVSDPTK